MYDVIVIGAGPAGLSAAIYAQRSGKRVLVLEGKSYGGQIINTSKIENYPGIQEISGFGFATDLYQQAKAMGAEIRYEKCLKIEKVKIADGKITSGKGDEDRLPAGEESIGEVEAAEEERVIDKEKSTREIELAEKGISSEEAEAAEEELLAQEIEQPEEKTQQTAGNPDTTEQGEFIVSCKSKQYTAQSIILAVGAVNRKLDLKNEEKLTGKGVSYCATCDGAFYKGKNVAVVGGGNTALEDAIFLSNYCSNVYLIHRRDTFRGEKKWELLLRERQNVHFYLEQTVSELVGEQRLQGLTLRHVVTGKETSLEVDGVFIAVGQKPATSDFAPLLETDQGGYVKAGEDCQTSIPGIYVAGDCRAKQVRQLTTAVADGSVAALAACAYIEQTGME
ncbi:MAG: FAD-dependent oxidoreductase [Lachnospiraceae bacterium]|nr:FAD-dependent oxidoreductase [Lachnospiraceae bacterium]